MLKETTLRERLNVLKDPLTMCAQLELRPSPKQREILGILATCPAFYQAVGAEDLELEKAIMAFALWRLLSNKGSSGLILVGRPKLGYAAMDFLEAITQRKHVDLAAVTSFPTWDVLRVSADACWELRLLKNSVDRVKRRAPEALFSVVLGAKDSDPAFVEACKALEEHSTHPKHTRIVVW